MEYRLVCETEMGEYGMTLPSKMYMEKLIFLLCEKFDADKENAYITRNSIEGEGPYIYSIEKRKIYGEYVNPSFVRIEDVLENIGDRMFFLSGFRKINIRLKGIVF